MNRAFSAACLTYAKFLCVAQATNEAAPLALNKYDAEDRAKGFAQANVLAKLRVNFPSASLAR